MMTRTINYVSYVVFSALLVFAASIYKFVVGLFFLALVFDSYEPEFSFVTYIIILAVLPMLFGFSMFGFYFVYKIIMEMLDIHLSLKIGALLCSAATVYVILCFVPDLFPQLPIPFWIIRSFL